MFELRMEQVFTLQCVCMLMQNITGQPNEERRADQTRSKLVAMVKASYVSSVYLPPRRYIVRRFQLITFISGPRRLPWGGISDLEVFAKKSQDRLTNK